MARYNMAEFRRLYWELQALACTKRISSLCRTYRGAFCYSYCGAELQFLTLAALQLQEIPDDWLSLRTRYLTDLSKPLLKTLPSPKNEVNAHGKKCRSNRVTPWRHVAPKLRRLARRPIRDGEVRDPKKRVSGVGATAQSASCVPTYTVSHRSKEMWRARHFTYVWIRSW